MNVNEMREMYPEGTQIVLTEMRGENQIDVYKRQDKDMSSLSKRVCAYK